MPLLWKIRPCFSSIEIMFDAKHEINKMTQFRNVKVFLFREMQKAKFC